MEYLLFGNAITSLFWAFAIASDTGAGIIAKIIINVNRNNRSGRSEIKKNKMDITVEDTEMLIERNSFENQNAIGMSFIKRLMDELEYICNSEIGTKIKVSKYNGNKL